MPALELPVLTIQDFTKGLLMGLARHDVTEMPDPWLDIRPSEAAKEALESLETKFPNHVEPRFYIKCDPSGFAMNWVDAIGGFMDTLIHAGDPDELTIYLNSSCLRWLTDEVPGPQYLWDALAKVFIASIESEFQYWQ